MNRIARMSWTEFVGRFVGGALVGVAFFTVASLWIPEYPLAAAVLTGTAFGGYIAIGFAQIHAKLTSRFRRRIELQPSESGLGDSLYRGIATARFISVVIGIPASAVLSAIVCTIWATAELVFGGHVGALHLFTMGMNVAFWWCGLYLHAALFAAGLVTAAQVFAGLVSTLIRRLIVAHKV